MKILVYIFLIFNLAFSHAQWNSALYLDPFPCSSATEVNSADVAFSNPQSCTSSVSLQASQQSRILIAKGFGTTFVSQRDFNVTGLQIQLSASIVPQVSGVTVSAWIYSGTTQLSASNVAQDIALGPNLNIGNENQTWGIPLPSFPLNSNLGIGIQIKNSGAQAATISISSLRVKLFGYVKVVVSSVSPSFQIGKQMNLKAVEIEVFGNNFYDLRPPALRNPTSPTRLKCRFNTTETAASLSIQSPNRIICYNPPTQNSLGYYPVSVLLGDTWSGPATVLFLYKSETECGNCSNGFCDPVSGICSCRPFWTGPSCNISDCSAWGSCLNGGTCVRNPGSAFPTCSCPAGFTGANCSIASQNPVSVTCSDLNNCNGNGNCVNDACVCTTGWSGPKCATPSCGADDCNGRGTCTAPNTCTCQDGWDPASKCKYGICTPGCSSGQICLAPGVCTCDVNSGYELPFCEFLGVRDCASVNQCSGNGECLRDALENRTFCDCISGWLDANCSQGDCSPRNNCNFPNGDCIGPRLCLCREGWGASDCSFAKDSTQPGESSKSNSIALIAGLSAFGGVLILLVIGFIILFIFWKKRGAKRKNRVLKEPKYAEIAFASDAKASKYSIDARKYQPLEELLLQKNLDIVQSLSAVTQSTEADNVSKAIVHFFSAHGRGLELMLTFIDKELAIAEGASTLFRANSMATKMFKVYSKILGLPYLFKILAHHIDGIIVASKEQELAKAEAEDSKKKGSGSIRSSSINSFELEVDPTKMEEGSDQIANKFQLLLIAQKIFTSIVKSVDIMPPTFRAISGHVFHGVAKKYPGNEYKAVGGFLFLRFICPSLVAPHTYALSTDPPSTVVQRQLVLLSKILQNLANDAEFGAKEEYMAKLNAFVQDNKPELEKFYERIVAAADKEKIEEQATSLPANVKENALGFLHEHLVNNQEKVNADLDSHPNAQVLKSKLKEVLSELGPPVKNK